MDTRTEDEVAYGGCHTWIRILFHIINSLDDCDPSLFQVLRDTAYAVKANELWDAAVNIASARAGRHGLATHYQQARDDCEKMCFSKGVDVGATAVIMDIAGILSVRHLLSDDIIKPAEEYLARVAVLTSSGAKQHNGHSPCGNLSCLSCYHQAVRVVIANGETKIGNVLNGYVGFVPALAIILMIKRLTATT